MNPIEFLGAKAHFLSEDSIEIEIGGLDFIAHTTGLGIRVEIQFITDDMDKAVKAYNALAHEFGGRVISAKDLQKGWSQSFEHFSWGKITILDTLRPFGFGRYHVIAEQERNAH